MTEDLGRVLAGRYRLSGLLGRGGMGTVWRAHDVQLDREVAVKELRLPEDLDGDARDSWIARLDREARAAARLKHHGVITVHDRITSDDGRPWIVMELVHGPSLGDLIAARGPLQPDQVAHVGLQVLAAVRAAHRVGITHRDIKPSNVLLEGERVVLTDFGIAVVEGDATLTRSGALMGTPAFMAPEQVRGLPATAESDLWSLGATLFNAVEGSPPFPGSTAGAVLVAVATEEPAPAVHAGPLAPLLAGLLHKDPARRLSAEAAHGLLAGLARDAQPLTPLSAPPPGPPVPPTERLTDGAGHDDPAYGEPAREPWAGGRRPDAHAPDARQPDRRRTYRLGALTSLVTAAVIAVPAWILWPDSSGGTGSGATGTDARGKGASAPASPTPSTGPSSPAPVRTPETPASSPPPPTRTPSRPAPSLRTPMDRAAIDRVFEVYMNGLQDQNMTELRRGTCPRLRSTLLGFVLNDHFVDRWTLLPYEIPPFVDQLSVEAKVTRRDLETGQPAGDVLYQWIIERDAEQNYWVCGWLNGR
ncbi:serine/threonine-protein kinase [Streptomyces sp. NPDC006512]|uniref:serine/threonine-protein kinase n=1 Tax=Streptomyces sp. NPDC006512 TaxID=3154307 RepID=UPI0033A030ED